jgi:hypothetical protein
VGASGLSLLLLNPVTAQATPTKPQPVSQGSFEPPPGRDRPQRTGTGGSRDSRQCLQAATGQLPPIVTIAQAQATTAVVQVELPATAAKQVEFSLSDQNGQGIYQTTLWLSETPQTVKIPLLETIPALQPNQQYEWVISLICQPDDRLQDQTFTGWVRWINDQVAKPAEKSLK